MHCSYNLSVIDICTNQYSMGIGWVQVCDDQILHKFSAQIQLWPSSYKAELVSILSAISTCPCNSQIQIYTDSLSIILKYNKLLKKPLISSKILSLKYWPIWVTLLNYIKSFNLTINFYKVQAHNDNIYNDNADYLAKHHLLLPFSNLIILIFIIFTIYYSLKTFQ